MRRVFTAALALMVMSLGLQAGLAAAQLPQNLLQNPGFEGDYFPWGGINEAQVAACWTPWWRDRAEGDPEYYYYKPEYKQASGYVYPNRVHGGAAAQQWFTFYASHQAGMYQQVFNVTPGTRYRFSIWAQVWSSVKDNADVSVDPAYPNLQVGIDPTGDWNPWAPTVIWSGTYAFFDGWGQLSVEAVAQNSTMTVFMRSEPAFPVKHNDTYWDDAELVAVGEAGPRPAPSSTPPPYNSPAPSPTLGTPRPTPTCAPPPPDWVTYKVQPGDTLSKLAAARGTTLQEVISANCLGTTVIYVDQALLLPPAGSTSTPASTARPTASTSTPTSTLVAPTMTQVAAISPAAPQATPSAPLSSATSQPAASDTPIPLITVAFTPLPPATAAPAPQAGAGGLCGTAGLGLGALGLAGVLRLWRRGWSPPWKLLAWL